MTRSDTPKSNSESRGPVAPQDSGQPRPGSVGDPLAGRDHDRHPGTRKQSELAEDSNDAPAEGTDPSLSSGPTRTRQVPPA